MVTLNKQISNREVVSKSRALSESEPSSLVREIKVLNGDFLRLAPLAEALPHLGVVAAAEPTPPSGLSISVQHPILRFFQSTKVQIGQEGTSESDIRTEVGRSIDFELKL
ncbi:hypothetical protein H5410_052169 [Solanum commersonii]|uniref:Uncharacterized protein n=1 Tax=Solanum commersonii TaxID=4109 RepID=A0A9J5X2U8_SOLCO|nr:hypothetical protein H5410_052169 [Solanum commersonii]